MLLFDGGVYIGGVVAGRWTDTLTRMISSIRRMRTFLGEMDKRRSWLVAQIKLRASGMPE